MSHYHIAFPHTQAPHQYPAIKWSKEFLFIISQYTTSGCHPCYRIQGSYVHVLGMSQQQELQGWLQHWYIWHMKQSYANVSTRELHCNDHIIPNCSLTPRPSNPVFVTCSTNICWEGLVKLITWSDLPRHEVLWRSTYEYTHFIHLLKNLCSLFFCRVKKTQRRKFWKHSVSSTMMKLWVSLWKMFNCVHMSILGKPSHYPCIYAVSINKAL